MSWNINIILSFGALAGAIACLRAYGRYYRAMEDARAARERFEAAERWSLFCARHGEHAHLWRD